MKNLTLTFFALIFSLLSFSQCENDSINPTFVNFEPEITISCEVDLSVVFPVAIDNCDDSVEIAWYEEVLPGLCQNTYDITRLYRAFDDFGNQSVEMQIIHIVDESGPLFGEINNLTVDCTDSVVFQTPQVIDGCNEFTLTSFDIIDIVDSCTTSYTRVWQATDICGNTSSATQTITSTDQTPPLITGEIYIQITDTVNVDSIFVTVTDNCSVPTITYTDTGVSGGNVIRNYTVTDYCGNVSTFEQIIHIDTIPPPDDDDDEDDDDGNNGGGNLVAICHAEGNGSYHTIYVAPQAVPAHLAHGDYLGPCTQMIIDWQSILPNSDLEMRVIKDFDNKYKKFVKVK
jgi:hypothetical protein